MSSVAMRDSRHASGESGFGKEGATGACNNACVRACQRVCTGCVCVCACVRTSLSGRYDRKIHVLVVLVGLIPRGIAKYPTDPLRDLECHLVDTSERR